MQLVKAVQNTQREQPQDLNKIVFRLARQDQHAQFIDMMQTQMKRIYQCKANCHSSVES